MKKVHNLSKGEKFMYFNRIHMLVGSSYDYRTHSWGAIDIENGEVRFIGNDLEVETCKVKIVKEEGWVTVLPKRETMQVELEGDGYADGEIVYDSGKCPKCGWKFEDGDKDWEEPFCCHCGQRLHWFNEAESEESNE